MMAAPPLGTINAALRRSLRRLKDAVRTSRFTWQVALPLLGRLARVPVVGPWIDQPFGLLCVSLGLPDRAITALERARAGNRAWSRTIDRHLGRAQMHNGQIQAAEHYWSEFPDAGTAWYRAHFPPIPETSTLICGDASTTYLTHPDAPRKVAAELPLVKLIVLLRDPVARAYSEYRMFTRLGWEGREWEKVVDAEPTAGDNP